jgi:hypothetical protein
MNKKQLTEDGACASCGSKDLRLARDLVQYTRVEKLCTGEWETSLSTTEEMDNDDPMGNVRLFCSVCGEYHVVPEDLA